MALYPVIMCGGSGTRLWPASRPSRPKQFIPLAGNRSLFQDTVLRVAPLVEDEGQLIVVAGQAHRDWIVDQLAELEIQAQLLLEPEARDSAAAMAAAAAWTHRQDPQGILAFVASDHHVPDHQAFRQAVREAALSAAQGRIVTLGVAPTEASSAYGYIKPMGRGLTPVGAFREKPDATTARTYIEAGYLWNSGNFIVSTETLIGELRAHAPAVEAAATAALPSAEPGNVQLLTSAFSAAPKISIDYAVMEKTRHASVLEVDFRWSDLGAWDAIAASGEGNTGLHIFEDADGCLVRANDGVMVAAMGVHNLAIVVEPDAVLVCDLSRAQEVKKVVERIRASSPRHLDFQAVPPETLAEGGVRFADWMRTRALPTWSVIGQDADGGFAEALTLDVRAVSVARRARVQARQIYVYAQAGPLGWRGPWQSVADRGLTKLYRDYLRPDGLCRTLLTPEGLPLDETAMVYDQAFVLFALACAQETGIGDGAEPQRAAMIRDQLLADALPNGAFREGGDHSFQSNCHMHLLEAALAWEAQDPNPVWAELSDRIAGLAMDHFIDPRGFLREFFGSDWLPAEGDDGRLVEPGHQFEWAWLLARYGRLRGSERHVQAAQSLYRHGRRGVADRPVVAVDAMNDDLTLRTRRARLWPQTEWLKAALILAEMTDDAERQTLLADAAQALRALWLYLTPDGLWRDKMLKADRFIDEPAPASSFYHIMAAFGQLRDTGRTLNLAGLDDLSLS